MAFSKKAVEDRKTWLSNFVPGTFLDSDAATISYSDFVHKVCILQRQTSSSTRCCTMPRVSRHAAVQHLCRETFTAGICLSVRLCAVERLTLRWLLSSCTTAAL